MEAGNGWKPRGGIASRAADPGAPPDAPGGGSPAPSGRRGWRPDGLRAPESAMNSGKNDGEKKKTGVVITIWTLFPKILDFVIQIGLKNCKKHFRGGDSGWG